MLATCYFVPYRQSRLTPTDRASVSVATELTCSSHNKLLVVTVVTILVTRGARASTGLSLLCVNVCVYHLFVHWVHIIIKS